MTFRRFVLRVILTLLPAAQGCSGEEPSNGPTRYTGISDASAAVALDAKTFMVADDEQNTLQVYRTDQAGGPVQSFPWDEHLGIDPEGEHAEVDIEGATELAGRVYWIASHGRNKDGKWRPNRHRFFAITVQSTVGEISAKPFGKPCRNLILDLVKDRRMQDLGLARALGPSREQAWKLAPKRRGLNVEGLAATADGKSLLIAFRNPLADGKALLVPLNNPAAVLADGAAPEFGRPIRLRLEANVNGRLVGLGIRSIEYSRRHAAYLIIAGPHDRERVFGVLRWSGIEGEQPKQLKRCSARINHIEAFVPEALIVFPERSRVQILSDDGTLRVKVQSPAECRPGTFDNGRCQAKFLLDDRRKTFRSIWVECRARADSVPAP